MSDFDDDEQDVPFADHSTERDHDENGDHTEDRDQDAAAGASGPRAGGGAGDPLGDLAGEARKAFGMLRGLVTPLLDNYPEVREHLGVAGAEVANAYRAVIRGREQEWRDERSDAERITVEQIDVDDDADGAGDDHGGPGDDEGPSDTPTR